MTEWKSDIDMNRCFQVHPTDNVATLLDDAAAGAALILGGPSASLEIELSEPIKLGHKVALQDIAADEAVVKFGVSVGRSTRQIRRGEWVHLHNCRSLLDERSSTLDVESGATTDTIYE